jgi:hypothetical protein
MGGPIVRTGTTPAFWANWEKAFGKGGSASSTARKTAPKKPAKSAKSKPAAKAKKKKK